MNTKSRQQGTVCHWCDEKGFGFVLTAQEERLFFHIRDFRRPPRQRPRNGDRLSFTTGYDKRQRCCAQTIEYELCIAQPQRHRPEFSPDICQVQSTAFCFRYLFFSLLVLALLAGTFSLAAPLFYLEASLFTFWLYQTDKSLAKAGHSSRLSEESLQMFSLIGGWPGALIAQKLLHHKVHKSHFQREFRFVIYGNSCFVLWLISEPGRQFLHNIALF
jgi:uncharacterized membrane protein YsdA (DUF1294 family)/cold shock CspA family protein